MEKKTVRVPMRSARMMAAAVAAEVESRQMMRRCKATLTRSVERYYAAWLCGVTTYIDGREFRVDRVHAFTEWQGFEPTRDDCMMVVQLHLTCSETQRSCFVDCKMPVCWIVRRGLPVDIRLDDITWTRREHPDNSLWPVLDYDPAADAFVPSVRGERMSYMEWRMENGEWIMENGQWSARREATLDTSRMDNEK